MKTLVVDVEEAGEIITSAKIDITDSDTIETVAQRASAAAGLDVDEFIDSVNGELEAVTDKSHGKDTTVKIHRVCIELHFESNTLSHNFSANSKWSRVHRWACKQFTIARDACANLELHDGTENGPVLNESARIGSFTGCKPVWLVKPGPEQYGQQ
jgi:hypothetical protein